MGRGPDRGGVREGMGGVLVCCTVPDLGHKWGITSSKVDVRVYVVQVWDERVCGWQAWGFCGMVVLCADSSLGRPRRRSRPHYGLVSRPLTEQSHSIPNDDGVASICASLRHANELGRCILFDWQLVWLLCRLLLWYAACGLLGDV